jgi:hypothetical protein
MERKSYSFVVVGLFLGTRLGGDSSDAAPQTPSKE